MYFNFPKFTIGLDEVGRGSFAGPVIAAAVAFNRHDLPPKKLLDQLRDSKQLSPKRRFKIFKQIVAAAHKPQPKLAYGLGSADNHTIDQINIRQASFLAMQRALNELFRQIECKYIQTILVDGRDNFTFVGFDQKPVFIIKGDQKVKEIAAASIIAKVFRDQLMKTYHLIYPEHGFQNHKGYGTREHRSILKAKSRITSIHRLSYKPIKNVISKNGN